MKFPLDKNFSDPLVQDTVQVGVPQVDHGKTDACNILACVRACSSGLVPVTEFSNRSPDLNFSCATKNF